VPATVTETLDALAGLRLVRYSMDKDADFKLYGLQPPVMSVEIGVRTGKRILHIGRREGESKRAYARVVEAGRGDVFVIDEADVGRILRTETVFTGPVSTKKR